jgi:hypothetical protein
VIRHPSHGTSKSVRRRAALKLPLLLTGAAALSSMPEAGAAPGRWSSRRAQDWYRGQGWLVGANYIPANAVNQLEMFQRATFDPKRIDRELALARQVGFNTVRVFLHDQLWEEDRYGFLRRLRRFVSIAADHEIKPLLVLFDSCWDPQPKSGVQRAPVPGVHNSGWVQSPGTERLQDSKYQRILHDYVIDVVSQFRDDDRVLAWDVWNEPDNPAREYRKVQRRNKQQLVAALLPHVFRWVRSVEPAQPLTSGVWQGHWGERQRRSAIADIQLGQSDVISFHNYGDPAEFEARVDELTQFGRPILCTEYLARTLGSTVEGVLPVAKRRQVGAYNWGFVAGKTQTYLPWDSWLKPYREPPREWFHDLFHADLRPYRAGEIDVIRRLRAEPPPG